MNNKIQQSGQALVVLLVYMIIAITLSTTAVAVVMSNSLAATKTEEGGHALEIAEAGAENALLRLIRATNYSGETLTVGNGSATVTVSGAGSDKTISSNGVVSGFQRTIRVVVRFTGGVMTILSWEEI